jgi:acyl-CoA dehydrogenase
LTATPNPHGAEIDMDMQLTEQQQAIDKSVRQICAGFDDNYWTDCEENSRFPIEYYNAMATHGWLGITMPEEVDGAGLGVTDAAIMMHAATSGGGGYSAASAIHINLFGRIRSSCTARRSRRRIG